MIPLGVALFFLSVGIFESENNILFGITLAFSAGVFLCISLSDLLPEIQFHSHDRLAMSGMLVSGAVAAVAIDLLPLWASTARDVQPEDVAFSVSLESVSLESVSLESVSLESVSAG